MTSEASPYPLRVAAIDVGTNAIRFVASEFLDAAHRVDLDAQRVPLRLGHSAFLTGELEADAIAATVEAMAGFRRALDTHGVARYRAVATSAVRESRNGGELVRRVRRESGIRLETITGSEEARLVWLAVGERVALGAGRWLLADLGGGSLEISLVSAEAVLWTETHRMGTVRLLEDLAVAGASPDDFRTMVEEYAGTLRIPELTRDERLEGLVATGGNIEALARLAGREPGRGGVASLPLEMLREAIHLLGGLTVEQRMARLNLRRDRADVILPAAVVYERVAVLAGLDTFVVPHVGVKEGILADLRDELSGPSLHASRHEMQALHGALAVGRRFQFDEAHGRHVAGLAASLFDQLRDVHGLGDDDRRILLGAAALHDVGQLVSHRKHHKHSLYLIANSELPGYDSGELELVALVARYHRRAEPRKGHVLYRDLDARRRRRVRRLASILRIADALDREHLQKVNNVRATVRRGRLHLEVRGRGELLLERWALEKKARMFENTFDLTVEVVVGEAPDGPSPLPPGDDR